MTEKQIDAHIKSFDLDSPVPAVSKNQAVQKGFVICRTYAIARPVIVFQISKAKPLWRKVLMLLVSALDASCEVK